VLVLASAIIGKHKRSREKDQPYECGMRPHQRPPPISRVILQIGLLFVLFDIEAIFLPWA
jgi:NADH:ubiquinone oxidoreductase subunit 3 (subunit A)